MSSVIFLNTRDAISGSKPYDATFTFNKLAQSDLRRYNVQLESVEFANIQYPIGSDRNNYIVFFQENSDTGITYSATLSSDSYTGAEFASALQVSMNSATGNAYVYTVAYDTSTKKLTFSEATNSPFRIIDGGSGSAHIETGWDVSTQTSFVTASTETGQPVQLQGSLYVDILSDLQTSNISTSSTGNVLMRVPLQSSFGEITYYRDLSGRPMELLTQQLIGIRLYLRDDRNREFSFPDNFDVSYTIRLSRN